MNDVDFFLLLGVCRQQQKEEKGGAAGQAVPEASARAGLQRARPAAGQGLLLLRKVCVRVLRVLAVAFRGRLR